MIHRHLDYPAATPPDELPLAAVADILDRGDLDDWRPLAATVARAPYGPVAERIADLIDRYPMYGTSPLWRAFLDRCRSRPPPPSPPDGPVHLATLRRSAGLTQPALAERMGISQSDLSKLERRRDLHLSTLEAYVHALGGRIHLVAELPGRDVEITIARPGPEAGAPAGEATPR